MFYIWLACATTEVAPSASAPVDVAAAVQVDAPVANWTHYGAPFAVNDITLASAVLGSPAEAIGKTLRLEGRLTEVCQKKGCWVVMADDAGHTLRVTMKDHAFGVATTDGGKVAQVEGTVVSKPVDPETEAHYRSEGATTAPTPGVELIATGASVQTS